MKYRKHSTMAKRSLAVLLAGAMMLTVVPVDNRVYAMDVEEETGTEATEAEKNVMTEAAEPDEKKTTTEASEPTEKNVMTETAGPEEKKAMAEADALTEGDIAINADAENDTTYTYTVEDGTYTYTVDEEGNATITDYAGEATTINIPDAIDGHMVTVIGDDAFSDCANLSAIELPNGLTTLGARVFSGTSVTSITIPKTLEKCNAWDTGRDDGSRVYEGPFSGCSTLKTINFEESTTQIADYLFAGYGGMETVTIPDTVTAIGSYAFADCANLSAIELPNGLTTLGARVFSGTSVTSITIPKTLEECNGWETERDDGSIVYEGPFSGCSTLKTINFEEGITQIASYLFAGYEGMETVTIPDTVTAIGSYAFANCENLSSIDLPKGLTTLATRVFSGTSIVSVTIPKSLEQCAESEEWVYDEDENYVLVYKGPFSGCSTLRTANFEEGATQIVDYLFAGCEGVETITIPDTVTMIGNNAFANCKNLSAIDLPKGLEELGGNVFIGSSLAKITIPKSLEKCGGEDDNFVWHDPFNGCSMLKTVEFEAGVTEIVGGLFSGCEGIETIEIPNTVIKIGREAFKGCTNLDEITLPNSVTYIGSLAFNGCTSLKNIELPEQLETIGYCAFQNCEKLTSVSLPSGLKKIGALAFENTAISSITIPKSLCVSGYYFNDDDNADGPFRGCTKLKTVEFEEGVTQVVACTFEGCEGIENITIPDTVTKIGDKAFANCTNLEGIVIPNTVTEIGNEAFSNCESLKKITIPDVVTEIGIATFSSCTNLKEIIIPAGVEVIGMRAFEHCTNLESIEIPAGVTEIRDEAFSNCKNLSKIDLPNELTTLGTSVFSGTSITSITIPKTLKRCMAYLDDENKVYKGPFSGCSMLKTINFEEGITYIAGYTFLGFEELKNIEIPDTVTIIDTGAFKYCSNLTKIYMGANITSIADDAFNTPEQTVIYGISGTYPEKYAKEKGFKFVDRKGQETQITGITLDKTEVSLKEKETVQLTAEVAPANATNKKLNWESSAPAVATVDSTGRVTAVAAGSAVITCSATDGSFVTATCKVTVTKPEVKVTRITLNKTNASIEKGKTLQLKATVTPTNATTKAVTWKSSNTKIATVSSTGKVTAKATGTVTITCTAKDGSGKKATCKITVIKPTVKVTKITINKTKATLVKGENISLKATVTPTNATNKAVTWKSSNTRIATVSSTGKVTAKAVGTVTITCTAKDGSGKKATCKITVRNYTKTEAYVARIYTKALGRNPEIGGLKYWTGEINAKRKTPVQVAEAFFFAPEFTNKKLNNTAYVRVLYQTFMGRKADQGGLNYWVGRLNKGESRKRVLEAFAGCPEFQKIVKSFGL